MTIKSDYPTVTKKIEEDDNGMGWNDVGDYEIGQTVPYYYSSIVPNMNGYDTYKYVFHDKMDEALTFHKDSVNVTISNGTKTYTLKNNEFEIVTDGGEDTFTVTISNLKSIVDRQFSEGFNNLNEKASYFVGHLCKQPFRNQYRVLSMYDSWLSIVGERFPNNLTLGDLQMLTDKLMNVFEVYVNQHSRGNKFLTSKTPNYAAWVVKFLLENDILVSGSQMLPVMEEDSMNNALIALSASATRQIQTNSSLVFNFFIRLSFVKQIMLTLGEDGQSFEKFVNLFVDSNLTKLLGDMHAYVNSKINFAMSLKGDDASNKMFGIVKFPQVLNTEEQGLIRKLVSLIQLTTVAPDNTETVQFSFYRLFAVLADMLRSKRP